MRIIFSLNIQIIGNALEHVRTRSISTQIPIGTNSYFTRESIDQPKSIRAKSIRSLISADRPAV